MHVYKPWVTLYTYMCMYNYIVTMLPRQPFDVVKCKTVYVAYTSLKIQLLNHRIYHINLASWYTVPDIIEFTYYHCTSIDYSVHGE